VDAKSLNSVKFKKIPEGGLRQRKAILKREENEI